MDVVSSIVFSSHLSVYGHIMAYSVIVVMIELRIVLSKFGDSCFRMKSASSDSVNQANSSASGLRFRYSSTYALRMDVGVGISCFIAFFLVFPVCILFAKFVLGSKTANETANETAKVYFLILLYSSIVFFAHTKSSSVIDWNIAL